MGKESLTGSMQAYGRGCPDGDAKFVLGLPRDNGIRGPTVRTATATILSLAALALGACGSLQSVMPDPETFRPPDRATLFRPLSVTGNFKDKVLPPVSPQDLVDASGNCAGATVPVSGEPGAGATVSLQEAGVPLIPAA